jgi:hypothetical protein
VLHPVRSVTSGNSQPLYYVFSGFISGNLSLMTIVVSVNQLVLSRQLQTPNSFRNDLESIADFRRDVAQDTERTVAPITPADFLEVLLSSLDDELDALREVPPQMTDSDNRRRVEDLLKDLSRQAGRSQSRLNQSEMRTLDAVVATHHLDLSRATNQSSRLRATCGDDLPDDGFETLERIATTLQQIDVAREYFRTLYTQEYLSQMSRVLLYIGVPAQLILASALLEFVGLLSAHPPAQFSAWTVYLFVIFGLVPLAVVFSFIVRAATIAHWSVTTTQFSSPGRDR